MAFYAEGSWVSLTELLAHPDTKADYLVLEWKTRQGEPAQILERVHAMGWKAERLREFETDGATVAVWALRR